MDANPNPDMTVAQARGPVKGTRKAPATANYAELPYSKWTVTTLGAYCKARHEEVLRLPYEPFRNYGAESRMMKEALFKYGAEVVALAYDFELKQYRPSPQYPGFSFGFAWSWRKEAFQRAYLAVSKPAAGDEGSEGSTTTTTESQVDWL